MSSDRSLRVGSLRTGPLRTSARGGKIFASRKFIGMKIDRLLGSSKLDKSIKRDIRKGLIKFSPQGQIQLTKKGESFFKMKNTKTKLKRRG